MMLSHEELISELPQLEGLSAPERRRLNDQRRAEQIARWRGEESEVTEMLEKQHQHPLKRRKTCYTPQFDPGLVLLNCAALGDVEGVKKLLSEGVNPTVYNVDRITPLHQSCLENDEAITELLIGAGCDIDSMDNELWTPLHAAVSLANLECVQLLLRHNADQLSPNVDGQLPIDLCEDLNISAIMEMDLRNKGITENDLTVARTSQETKFFNDVKQMLEGGVNPNFTALDNDATLLHVAAANGYVEVALYLFSHSCKVDFQDIDGWTPLHAAAFWGEVDIIELLASHGADFKLRSLSGELPGDLTEDDDIKMLLQRLTERSELIRKHPPGGRPSSVRGRLVSRMTTVDREDKRRESAELHNFFVEQIEQEIAKAPDSWRVRTGKYVRPALREIAWDQDGNQITSPDHMTSNTANPGVVGAAQRPSLEQSVSEEESEFNSSQNAGSDVLLTAIAENGESNKAPDNLGHLNQESFEQVVPRVGSGAGVSDATFSFEFISPSTDTLLSDTVWNNKDSSNTGGAAPQPEQVEGELPFTELRREKSFDNLVSSSEDEAFKGSNISKVLLRSSSLQLQAKPAARHLARFNSLRVEMQGNPGYSPKPSTSKYAYKNRKKAGSNVSRQSSETQAFVELETSIPLPTSHNEEDELPSEVQLPADKSTPVHQDTPGNSMVTHDGSLSGDKRAGEAAEKGANKSKKCCVIL